LGIKKQITIESMDLEAQGIARLSSDDEHSPNKVIFVAGALPGERVEFQITQDKSKFLKGKLTQIYKPAIYRRTPQCPWYGNCGGCTMQHLDSKAQIALKQRVLEDQFKHLGKVKPSTMLRPVAGPDWGYRYRARLSVVNRSIKKGTVLVGFHEPQNSYVADMTSCEILPQQWSQLLPELRKLVMALSIRDRIPQIELAMAEQSTQMKTSMVLRILLPLTQEDEEVLIAFAKKHHIWIWTQTHGPETVKPFYPLTGELFYDLPEFGIRIPFQPTDFTQVNHSMNQVLVGKAIRLLEISPHEGVLDLFCGIGNFTLPLATMAREVLGIEGSAVLCERAQKNALSNSVPAALRFLEINLFTVTVEHLKAWGYFEKWLIDPPRDGAYALVQALRDAHQSKDVENLQLLPQRIVYVSCNPATLARDAGVLVNEAGYELSHAGIMNMFPHTSHVESIAVFKRL
jgi:23S rRNA (uracil1939-C5)-methyltransferase